MRACEKVPALLTTCLNKNLLTPSRFDTLLTRKMLLKLFACASSATYFTPEVLSMRRPGRSPSWRRPPDHVSCARQRQQAPISSALSARP